MVHSCFELVRKQHVKSFNIGFEDYRHKVTGAQHIHLSSDSNENVFLVLFRTAPQDSTGVAHVLEHTILCGSEKYSLRDPFFQMARRSINTFMNAFASSDWTAFTFASQNAADYFNLLDFFLDAAFFPTLNKLDFFQEGHRLEYKSESNPGLGLVRNGVVLNEMIGSASSPNSQLWHKLCEHLFPTTTYRFNSGGEPNEICNLTHQNLVDFHSAHYHPSNAVFVTYGSLDVTELQKNFEEKVLSRFSSNCEKLYVPNELSFSEPIIAKAIYPTNSSGDAAEQSHFIMGWLLGKSTNVKDFLEAKLLEQILLGNSASPLAAALETYGVDTTISPLSGLDNSCKSLVFICGLDGYKNIDHEKAEAAIIGVLNDIVSCGIDQENVESALHQLELGLRDVSSDEYPYGLQIIFRIIGSLVHCDDPVMLLNVGASIEELKVSASSTEFVKNLIKKWILNNPHRVTLIGNSSKELSNQSEEKNNSFLKKLHKSLSEDEKNKIANDSVVLREHQSRTGSVDALPKISLSDIQNGPGKLKKVTSFFGANPICIFHANTNDIIYQNIAFKLPSLKNQLVDLLPLYCDLLTEIGFGEKSYLDVQKQQAKLVGSFHVYPCVLHSSINSRVCESYIIVATKSTKSNFHAMNELVRATLVGARFDELNRLRELVSQKLHLVRNSIVNEGHKLAMLSAGYGLNSVATLKNKFEGLISIENLQRLEKRLKSILKSKSNMASLTNDLLAIHDEFNYISPKFSITCGVEEVIECELSLSKIWPQNHTKENDSMTLDQVENVVAKEVWLTNTQSNYCAKVYPSVNAEHIDAASLIVLAELLRNEYLRDAIRKKGGAYSGGAIQDCSTGTFCFYSYRDPRLEETLNDFDSSIRWLHATKFENSAIEEAILCSISKFDKPMLPADEARNTFENDLFGLYDEKYKILRAKIKEVTIFDILKVASKYLCDDTARICLITNARHSRRLKKAGYMIRKI